MEKNKHTLMAAVKTSRRFGVEHPSMGTMDIILVMWIISCGRAEEKTQFVEQYLRISITEAYRIH